MLDRIAEGRTDGATLAQSCAYYGDVSALRPAAVLRLLCFGPHRIHPGHRGMAAHLLGRPLDPAR